MSITPPRKKLKQTKITAMFPRQVNADMMDCDGIPRRPSTSINEDEFQVLDVWNEDPTPEDQRQNDKTESANQKKSPLHLKNFTQDFKKKLQVPSKMEEKSPSPGKRKAKKSTVSTSQITMDTPSQKSDEQISWRGTPLNSLTILSKDKQNIPDLKFCQKHTVLVKLPVHERQMPEPYPDVAVDIWDSNHVRMPHSLQSLYPAQDGSDTVITRWAVICGAFKNPVETVDQLVAAVVSYNQRFKDQWTFKGLKRLIEEEFDEEESSHFFKHILPGIIKLALSLPTLFTSSIPLLKRDKNKSVTMSQKQVSCLLANAFLCTFPKRNSKGYNAEYRNYPDINFNRFLMHKEQHSLEKIKCLLHYFKEVLAKEPDGLITFTRQCMDVDTMDPYECSSASLPRFHIDTHGFIEEQEGFLQMDFANRFIGGGVLGLGCVQEEIRFVLCPELIVTRLFTESLSKNEAFFVIGAERFNKGSGYSRTFKWEGPYYDVTPRDRYKRRLCQIVCLNARSYMRDPSLQYRTDDIMGDLHKAYVGFKPIEGSRGDPPAVATGNWGCGAFRGDPILKGLIQFAASGLNNRDIAYFTFGDRKIRDTLATIFEDLKRKGITVGELVMGLCQYGRTTKGKTSVLEYINKNLLRTEDDDDSQMEVCQPASVVEENLIPDEVGGSFDSSKSPLSDMEHVCTDERIQEALDSSMNEESMTVEVSDNDESCQIEKSGLLESLNQIDQAL